MISPNLKLDFYGDTPSFDLYFYSNGTYSGLSSSFEYIKTEELDSEDIPVQTYTSDDIGNFTVQTATLYTTNPSNIIYTTTMNGTYPNNATIFIHYYMYTYGQNITTETNDTIYISDGGLKYSITFYNWNWTSPGNTLRIWIRGTLSDYNHPPNIIRNPITNNIEQFQVLHKDNSTNKTTEWDINFPQDELVNDMNGNILRVPMKTIDLELNITVYPPIIDLYLESQYFYSMMYYDPDISILLPSDNNDENNNNNDGSADENANDGVNKKLLEILLPIAVGVVFIVSVIVVVVLLIVVVINNQKLKRMLRNPTGELK